MFGKVGQVVYGVLKSETGNTINIGYKAFKGGVGVATATGAATGMYEGTKDSLSPTSTRQQQSEVNLKTGLKTVFTKFTLNAKAEAQALATYSADTYRQIQATQKLKPTEATKQASTNASHLSGKSAVTSSVVSPTISAAILTGVNIAISKAPTGLLSLTYSTSHDVSRLSTSLAIAAIKGQGKGREI